MPKVVMYLKSTCPYCQSADVLLKEKGVNYEAIDLLQQPEKRDEMIKLANNRTTVPQIFINDQHIGGFDDLSALEHSGELDKLLKN